MNTPLTNRRTIRRATGALAALASVALVAACGAGTALATGASGDSQSSGTTWTTISSSVRQASTGATVAEILEANAQTSTALSAADSMEQAGSWDTASATTITLSGTSAEVSGSASHNVKAEGGTVIITGAGTYVLSGELSDGEVVVSAPDADVTLVLDGVTITNADRPALDVQDAGSAVVVLADGTSSSLSDGATYSDTSESAATAALFSSDTLVLTGTGELAVTGRAKDGISAKNGLAVTGSPTITVEAADDGLRGKDWLVVDGGTLTVTAGGDALKSSETDDETKGFVALGKATVTLTSADDAISATTDVTVDGTTLDITAGGGQANASVQQDGPGQAPGDQDSASDTTPSPKGVNAGVAYSQASGTVRIDAADEGVQAAFPTVTGGELTILSGDDGINATNGDYTIEGYESADSESDDGAYLTISGGTVQIDYAGSDGIDSNGSAAVTGGEVLVGGQSGAMDGAVDVNGEATMVGVSTSQSVSAGDTVSVSGPGVSGWEVTSAVSSTGLTVLGLSDSGSYTVTTTSGGQADATASALAAAAGGPGGQGGPQGPGGR